MSDRPRPSRLAQWVPAPPATRAGRVAARLWASPVTLVGLLAGCATGCRPRRADGVVLFAPARGLFGRGLPRRFTAMALGHVVLSRSEPDRALLAHELVHVRQAERLGPAFLPVYLALHARHGYHGNPLELAAVRGAGATPRGGRPRSGGRA